MARALIVGGGAIGRGFLPWLLEAFEIDILDTSRALVEGIAAQGGYHTFMSDGVQLQTRRVVPRRIVQEVAALGSLDYDLAFIAVGPRHVTQLPAGIASLRCPVFSLENDPRSVDWLAATYGWNEVYFGVPDVITSSTASPAHRAQDPFALHTEDGVLYLQRPATLDPTLEARLPLVQWLAREQLEREWDAKLYLHNTPHCIAAYLGHRTGCTYLHEAMARPAIRRMVDGVIDELLNALQRVTRYDHRFIEAYAAKEVRRFSNPLLYDPVRRVAREPLRKLQPAGRLMGALRILLATGITPTYLMAGIAAALRYDDPTDPDHRLLTTVDRFGLPAFLRYHLGMAEDRLEAQYVAEHFSQALGFLDRELR